MWPKQEPGEPHEDYILRLKKKLERREEMTPEKHCTGSESGKRIVKVKMSEAQYQALCQFAEIDDRPKSGLLRHATKRYINTSKKTYNGAVVRFPSDNEANNLNSLPMPSSPLVNVHRAIFEEGIDE